MIERQNIADLALFQQLFADNRQFVHIVEILEEEMATDGSSYQLRAETVIDRHECLLDCSFNPHLHGPALEGDLWLAIFVEGDLNNGFLLQKLNNMKCLIHPKAREGETVLSSRKGKKINISNDPTAMLTENGVLGQELKSFLKELVTAVDQIRGELDKVILWATSHTHISASPGSPTAPAVPVLSANTTVPKNTLAIQKEDRSLDKLLSDLVYIQEKKLPNSPIED